LAAWVAPVAAQQQAVAGDQTARLVQEVAGLNRSLDHMVAMLEQVMSNQKVDLLLKRIEIKERRLAPMASDLRSMESEYDNRKTEIKRLREFIKQQEEMLADELRQGIDPTDSEARLYLDDLNREIQVEGTRLEELTLRIRRLQDEIADEREEIAILDEQLSELID
jgi:chromosome segregation ATPase